MEEELKVGDLVHFKYKKNGKTYEGRIDRIDTRGNSKCIYSVEAQTLIQPIYLENVTNGSGKDWREWDKRKWYCDWCFVRWFSRDYITKIN